MLYVRIILKKVGEILLFYSSYETDDILQRILSKYVKKKKLLFSLVFLLWMWFLILCYPNSHGDRGET